jgi:hypothetical protein
MAGERGRLDAVQRAQAKRAATVTAGAVDAVFDTPLGRAVGLALALALFALAARLGARGSRW